MIEKKSGHNWKTNWGQGENCMLSLEGRRSTTKLIWKNMISNNLFLSDHWHMPACVIESLKKNHFYQLWILETKTMTQSFCFYPSSCIMIWAKHVFYTSSLIRILLGLSVMNIIASQPIRDFILKIFASDQSSNPGSFHFYLTPMLPMEAQWPPSADPMVPWEYCIIQVLLVLA